ncbi:hypothetical protein B0J13DRAFT_612818 [Dactylonectria estremocensis]|uniref:CFEM domain-containing protein n=1 Tax=Dactylonectria estremocensis TaxID=1079267 RepID=A0A9P9DJ02_9HYPO|nr:hypothetical protein B0J13DRAFT_612818 [Dactylonectria estremocensis]
MKALLAILVMIAGLGKVNAHWGRNAKKYIIPSNSINHCDAEMKKSWTWETLSTGSFNTWNGWHFAGGWSCQSSSKRGLDGRTFGKAISSYCGHDVSSAPSFDCSSKSSVSSFSVATFHVGVEFDCRLELHYEMQDGSLCRQSHQCSSGSYNTITNTQCGGAKRVSFVYPKQGKSKDKCKIEIPSVGFHCKTSATLTTALVTTSTTSVRSGIITTSDRCTKPHCKGYQTDVSLSTVSTRATATRSTAITSANTGGYSCSASSCKSHIQTASTSSFVTNTLPTSSHKCSAAHGCGGHKTTTSDSGDHTQLSSSTAEDTTTTNQQPTTAHSSSSHTRSATNESVGKETSGCSTPHVVTYNSTSTPYTLITHTATSHGTGILNRTTESHPVVVTESVAVSTTVYHVTDTATRPGAGETSLTRLRSNTGTHVETKATIGTSYSGTSTIYATSLRTISSCNPEVTSCSSTSGPPVVVTETIAIETTVVSTAEIRVDESAGSSSPTHPNIGVSSSSQMTVEDHPATPTSGYDVPDVVPGCINTFLGFVKDCRDNTDAACYCPDQAFVNNVFQCLYAHGESDDVVAKAISFFQGICVGYVSENPAVYTGAESLTSIITVTGTTVIVSAPYTTVTVYTTITQPFIATDGSAIARNGTAVAISTEYAVPEIGFTTGPSGSVNVVPPATTGPAVTNTLYPTVTSIPAVTDNYAVPTSTSPGEIIVTGGAAQAVAGYAAVIFGAALVL